MADRPNALPGLLARQLRRAGGSAEAPPADWGAFLEAVSDAYAQAEMDRSVLERSLDLMSAELLDRNAKLRADLIRRVEAEDALRKSQERTRALVDALPDLLFRASADGRVLELHTGSSEDAKSLHDEIVDRRIAEVLPTDLAEEAMRRIASVLETKRLDVWQCALSIAGRARQFEARLVPLGSDEVLAVVRDVTDRNRMIEQIRISDRMVSVGTLAAGVAHEINNPLAYVITNLTFVVGELGDSRSGAIPRSEEVRSALHEALEGAERVAGIVRDLKTLTRGDDDRRGPVDVRRCLDSAAQMATNEIRHRARLVRDYSEVPPVLANDGRLSQVFLNLLVNAAQAIPEGRVDENEIRVSTGAFAGRVIVRISDTGPGIPEAVRTRIFEPFFTTKAVGSGTGLGLYVCHGIVTAMGGTIAVEDGPGPGTTFRIDLPVSASDAAPVAAPLPFPRVARRARVLLVDDEPFILRSLRRVLRDHQVTEADSARAALGAIERGEPFDLVLCDLLMPDGTGMDVYDGARHIRPGLEDRIVFMTGGTFTPSSREFLAAVRNRKLDKPFDANTVLALVAEAQSSQG